MNFTREPIIESIMTPKEGHKLVVRSSKGLNQEEFFVDSVEIVSFGHALFFRSIEKPKAFLLPTSDYEVLEVREARLVLKNVGIERTIKIGGGREVRPAREAPVEKVEESLEVKEEQETTEPSAEEKLEGRLGKKRDRRRQRRRRGREETAEKPENLLVEDDEKAEESLERDVSEEEKVLEKKVVMNAILPPPSTLISETISRYRDNEIFKGAFFERDAKEEPEVTYGSEESLGEEAGHEEDALEALDMQNMALDESSYGFFEEEEEPLSQENLLEDTLEMKVETEEDMVEDPFQTRGSDVTSSGAKE